MATKILLADDSTTIQKVIKITLANEDFELSLAASKEEMEQKLRKEKFDILLLDFGLTGEKSGYDLAKSVKNDFPQLKILMLYGTFDTVDESALKDAGVNDKIIKPFDSAKFIQKCKNFAQVTATSAGEFVSANDLEIEGEEDENSSHFDVGNWVVEGPGPVNRSSETVPIKSEKSDFSNQSNMLEQNVHEWGMSVPAPISDKRDGQMSMPPLMDISEIGFDDNTGEIELDLDALEFEEEISGSSSQQLGKIKLSSKLIPLSELNQVEFDEDDKIGEKTAILEVNSENDELEDLVNEERNSDDFWAADDGVELSANFESEDELDENDSVALPRDTDLEYPQVKASAKSSHSNNVQAAENNKSSPLVASLSEIEEKIRPLIQELVKEYCRESLEKVAWEVIPDLAENLIKQELGKISQEVLQEP